jgi:hypothetical protein
VELQLLCYKPLGSYFLGCHVIKGRARHPQSQGGAEQSNFPFKEALAAWMMENKSRNWAKYGMHIVNMQLNRRPSRVKSNYSLNQIFYGKRHDKLSACNILGHDIVKTAETEAGFDAAYKSKEAHSTDQMIKIIQDTDRECLHKLRDDGAVLKEKEDLLLLLSDKDEMEEDNDAKEYGVDFSLNNSQSNDCPEVFPKGEDVHHDNQSNDADNEEDSTEVPTANCENKDITKNKEDSTELIGE